jgi:glycogen operon protein
VLALEWRGTDAQGQADVVYCAMNMYWEPLDFELPSPPSGRRWHIFANTTMPTPDDVWNPGEEPPLSDQERLLVGGRSTIVLVAQ